MINKCQSDSVLPFFHLVIYSIKTYYTLIVPMLEFGMSPKDPHVGKDCTPQPSARERW